MRKITLSALIGLSFTGAGHAADFAKTCERGDDVRAVEVVKPGAVGAACDLKYVREDGANVSVPYHADNSETFCAEKARELVKSLSASGYDCADTAQVRREATLASDAAPAEAAPVASVGRQAAADQTPLASLRQPALDQPQTDFLADENAPQEILAQDAGVLPAIAASRAPIALSTGSVAAAGIHSTRRSSAVGRLIGAAPDAAPLPVQQAAFEERLAAPVSQPAAAPEPAAETGAPETSTQARTPEEVIESTLAAQTAAWNEGDIEAFMQTYWKNPELSFVSGATVTKGWKQTMSRYRERYGDGAALGRLTTSALDIEMISEEVAVVVGRFDLTRDGGDSSGAFSLVMQRFDGLWRIVHDHTTADESSTL